MNTKLLESVLNLLSEKEAFDSCKIEGIYPKNMSFIDYLKEKSELERKEKLRKKRLQKKLKQTS